jgi:hypothetical protein
VARALGGNGQAIKLPAQPDGKIADVDHLLHFAQALGHDLAGLQRHQRAQIILGRAQLLAQKAHQFAPPRRRHRAPGRNASCDAAITAGMSAAAVTGTRAISAPSMGE